MYNTYTSFISFDMNYAYVMCKSNDYSIPFLYKTHNHNKHTQTKTNSN